MPEIRRRAEVEKCPACGWRLDAGAYRCPKCRIYFCYKCRARVGERETQYQCADQSCGCYGKLLCSACVVQLDQTQTQQQPNGDATVVILIGGAVIGVASLFAAEFIAAAALAVGAVIAGSLGLRAVGFNMLGSKDLKHDVHCKYQHLCCVQCRHPVKHLR